MSDVAVELTDLRKQLGGFSLGPLSLSVPRGAIFAMIGPNGAGKTTTLDLLIGLREPDEGNIRILDQDRASHDVEIKRRTAYVSPTLNYQVWGTVAKAVAFIRGFYPDWDQARCERLLRDFNIDPRARVTSLSFGARIKLSLVMALSRNAELLLLDEPTVGLDPLSRRQVFVELLAFMRQEERTVIISSHQLVDLQRFADHVALLKDGKLLLTGRMDELVDRFREFDVRLKGNVTPPADLVRVLHRDGERARVLIDTARVSPQALLLHGMEVVHDTALTLEELFIALLGRQPHEADVSAS